MPCFIRRERAAVFQYETLKSIRSFRALQVGECLRKTEARALGGGVMSSGIRTSLMRLWVERTSQDREWRSMLDSRNENWIDTGRDCEQKIGAISSLKDRERTLLFWSDHRGHTAKL